MTSNSYTRLIIRDLRLDMGIGVYDFEKTAPQPVLINLLVDVAPPADWQADAYENVVCYATIVEGIRALAARGHVQLVETLAEQIAGLVLATKGVLAVTVRVEKTDIMPDAAAVGIEIHRTL